MYEISTMTMTTMMIMMTMTMTMTIAKAESSIARSDNNFLQDGEGIVKDEETRREEGRGGGVEIINMIPEQEEEIGRNTNAGEEDKVKKMIARPQVEIFIPRAWDIERKGEKNSVDWNSMEEQMEEGKRIGEEGEGKQERPQRPHVKKRRKRRRRRRKWKNKRGRKFYRRNPTYGVKKKSKRGDRVSKSRYSPNQRPPWMGEQSYRSLDPRRVKVRRHIVRQHNLLRAKVDPPAGDMLAVKWYKTAAEQAQSWAEQCEEHSDTEHPSVRWTSTYGACGQNVFVSPTKKRWSEVLKHWWDSKRHFEYNGANNSNTLVAAYTQMAWYNSHQLGCGFSQCHTTGGDTFYRYVCNYCPGGNDPMNLSRPYTIGSSCSLCSGSCRSLCPGSRCPLCTNACTYSDLWVNCRMLNQEWHEWLCNTKTSQGVERFKNCRATCECVNEIT